MKSETKAYFKTIDAKLRSPASDSKLEEILSELVSKFPRSYFSTIKTARFKQVYDFVMRKTAFAPADTHLATRITLALRHMDDVFRCHHCGKPIKRLISPVNAAEFFWCNEKCQAADPYLSQKIGALSIAARHKNNGKQLKLPAECTIIYRSSKIQFDDTKTAACFNVFDEHPKAFEHWIKKFPELHEYLLQASYPIDFTELGYGTRLAWIRLKLQEFPRCKTCGRQLDFRKVKPYDVFRDYCCAKCKAASPILSQQQRNRHTEELYHRMKSSKAIPLFPLEELAQFKADGTHYYCVKCTKCQHEFSAQIDSNFYSRSNNTAYFRCPICYPKTSSSHTSKLETDLFSRISSTVPHLEIISGDRRTISPLELDIYIPALHLAIEFDGSYWHRFDKTDKLATTRQLYKTQRCEEKGINLIHIWEDEYSKSRESLLTALLDIISQKKSIMEAFGPCLDTTQLVVDRSKISKTAIDLETWTILSEQPPRLIDRKLRGTKTMLVADCGTLTLSRVNK